MKNLQICICRFFIVLLVIGYYSNTIYVDSTGADSSVAENTVSIALFTHSFPRSGPENQHQLRKIAQTCLQRLPLFPSLTSRIALTTNFNIHKCNFILHSQDLINMGFNLSGFKLLRIRGFTFKDYKETRFDI